MMIRSMDEFRSFLDHHTLADGEQLMLYLGDRSASWLEQIRIESNARNITVFGGIFPGLLHDGSYMREGLLVQTVRPLYRALVHPFLFRLPSSLPPIAGNTAVVLIDGLSGKFRDLIDTMETKMGKGITYIGGGAGFYDMVQRPCLFDNSGVYQDAAFVCLLPGLSHVAVRHGWEKMDGPYEITEADQNILHSLDGCNAMDVYCDAIEAHRSIILSKEDFFAVAKEHPFGLLQADGTVVVRDPIACTDSRDIICVADLPKQSTAYILHGNKRTLLASSLEVADECARHRGERHSPMLFNCISRAMFLEDEFHKEIRNIQNQLAHPLTGTLSIGEIATRAGGGIVIHNKSTVIGLVPA